MAMAERLPLVRVGCCGFPCKRKDYFSQFKLVEVQQTFYKMPKLETALGWRNEAPPNFEFSVKAWQLITHPPVSPTYRKTGVKIPPGKEECYGFFRPSDEVHQAWEETKRFSLALGARVIVFQGPPSFGENNQHIDNMIRFFQFVQSTEFLFAWEPRGEWHEQTIKDLCADLGLIHCVDPFVSMPLSGERQYFRLHGGPRYRHRYSAEELEYLLDKAGDKDTYVLFNNINMYRDALAFDRLMKGSSDDCRGE